MSKPGKTAPRYAPGDRVPRLALPDRHGTIVDFAHQSLAGDAVLLWLPKDAPPKERLKEFHNLTPGFASYGTRAYAVLGRTPEDGPDDAPLLIDPERVIAQGVGLSGGGFALFGPDLTLVGLIEGEDLAPALEAAARLFARDEPRLVEVQAPVLLLPQVLEPELCRRLIAAWESGRKEDDVVSSRNQGHAYAGPTIKKRTDVVIEDAALLALLNARVSRRVVPAIERAFQMRMAHCEAFRIGCYDAASGGYFRRHRDNTTPYTKHRQFAVTLNLNTGEYEGGELCFPEFGRQRYRPPAGGAVIFSCSLLHEALPVSAGRRFGLFTFLYDAAGVRAEREMLTRERAAGRLA